MEVALGTCQRRGPAIMRMLQVNQGKPSGLDRKLFAHIIQSTTDITGSLGDPVQSVTGGSSVTTMGVVSRPLNDQSTGGFFGDSSTVAFIK
jgi:hypothetical protein